MVRTPLQQQPSFLTKFSYVNVAHVLLLVETSGKSKHDVELRVVEKIEAVSNAASRKAGVSVRYFNEQ